VSELPCFQGERNLGRTGGIHQDPRLGQPAPHVRRGAWRSGRRRRHRRFGRLGRNNVFDCRSQRYEPGQKDVRHDSDSRPGWTCRVASASDPRPVPARTSIRISSPRSVVRAVVAFSSSGLKMPSLRPLDWAFNPATALPTSTPGHHAANASAPHRRRQYRIQAAAQIWRRPFRSLVHRVTVANGANESEPSERNVGTRTPRRHFRRNAQLIQ
jgi:hypothetical protein